jgi:uncharacterized protein
MDDGPIRSEASRGLADHKERVVRGLLDALEQRDPTAIGAALADDVVDHFPGRGPVAGTYRNRDAVLGLFRSFGALFDEPLTMAAHDVVASEAHVVDLATYTGTRGGQTFTWNAVRIYHVDGDEISEVWLMIGDIAAFDAWLAG